MKASTITVTACALLGAFALPAAAAEKVCKLEITGNDMMQYDKKELKVAGDCTKVELTLKHVGKLPVQTMGHDWVLVKASDADAVAASGMKAGAASGYLDPADKRVISHTKLLGGGQSDTVTFAISALKKGEAYIYLCTFPGHSALMKGTLAFG